jgi:tetratricopeptide (TPR) repeat protein
VVAHRQRRVLGVNPLVALGVLVAVGVLTAVAGSRLGRPAYNYLKKQRGLRMIGEIQQLLHDSPERLPEAGRRVRAALDLAPGEPRLLRVAAQYGARIHNEAALQYWQSLVEMGQATRQDRLDFAGQALELNHLEQAADQVKSVLAQYPKDIAALRLRIRIIERLGDPSRAIGAARAALEVDPVDESLQYTLGELLLTTPTEATSPSEGTHLLWGLALGSGPWHDDSVNQLIACTNLTRAENEILIREIKRGNMSTGMVTLNVARLQAKIEPERQAEIIEETLRKLRPTTDLDLIGHTVVWLMDCEAFAAVLRFLPMEMAQSRSSFLSARLEALSGLERWDELQSLLDSPPSLLEPVHVHCLRALVSARTGRQPKPSFHFERALEVAGRNPVRLQLVARYGEFVGLPEIAIEAWKRLLPNPTTALHAARQIMRLSQPMDDIRLLRDTLARVADFVPNDAPVVSQVAYWNLVLGENVPAARSSLARLAAANPKEARYRVSLALGELRALNPTAALALLEQEPIEWDQVDDRQRAVYVAILGANEQREAARKIARTVNLAVLRAPERDWVRPWL